MRGYLVKKGARYYAVVYEGTDPLTRKERRTWRAAGTSRREAERFLAELVQARNSRCPVFPGRMSLQLRVGRSCPGRTWTRVGRSHTRQRLSVHRGLRTRWTLGASQCSKHPDPRVSASNRGDRMTHWMCRYARDYSGIEVRVLDERQVERVVTALGLALAQQCDHFYLGCTDRRCTAGSPPPCTD